MTLYPSVEAALAAGASAEFVYWDLVEQPIEDEA